MQEKLVTPYLFEHYTNPDEYDDDYEIDDATSRPISASNSAIENIFDRRRKIRNHGCKYLALIGSSPS